MNPYVYLEQEHALIQPSMERFVFGETFNLPEYEIYQSKWRDHCASLPRLAVDPKAKGGWKDGEQVDPKQFEVGYEVMAIPDVWVPVGYDRYQKTQEEFRRKIAIPIKAVQEEESQDKLWDNVEEIFDQHTHLTEGGYGADYTDRRAFFEEAQSKFTITRK